MKIVKECESVVLCVMMMMMKWCVWVEMYKKSRRNKWTIGRTWVESKRAREVQGNNRSSFFWRNQVERNEKRSIIHYSGIYKIQTRISSAPAAPSSHSETTEKLGTSIIIKIYIISLSLSLSSFFISLTVHLFLFCFVWERNKKMETGLLLIIIITVIIASNHSLYFIFNILWLKIPHVHSSHTYYEEEMRWSPQWILLREENNKCTERRKVEFDFF